MEAIDNLYYELNNLYELTQKAISTAHYCKSEAGNGEDIPEKLKKKIDKALNCLALANRRISDAEREVEKVLYLRD